MALSDAEDDRRLEAGRKCDPSQTSDGGIRFGAGNSHFAELHEEPQVAECKKV